MLRSGRFCCKISFSVAKWGVTILENRLSLHIFNFLSPKCYYVNEGHRVKRSNKGTPKHVPLDFIDYKRALFDNHIKRATFNRISIENRLGSVVTKEITKVTVNNLYMKLHVKDDLVSVRPHMVGDKFL